MSARNPLDRMSLVLEGFSRSGTPKLVMLGIALHDGDGGSWPKIKTLATYCAVHPRNVQRAIERLAEDGWLTVHPNEGGTHRTPDWTRPNRYELNYQRLADGMAEAPPGDPTGVAHAPSPPVAPARDRGGAGATRTRSKRDREPDRSARAPADAGAPLPIDLPAADPPSPERTAWRLIRAAYDERDRKPIENRQHVAKNVARLLGAGWTEDELARALLAAPAWTPSAIQVELTRGRSGRSPAKDAGGDMRGNYAEASGWGAYTDDGRNRP